jgi:hypothetical protein
MFEYITIERKILEQALSWIHYQRRAHAMDAPVEEQNLRIALAQQKQEKEPVAIVEGVMPHLEVIIIKHILGARFPKIGDLLYTSPLRREWQYLTETEIDETLDNNLEGGTSLVDICRAIEVKIKEKNHS